EGRERLARAGGGDDERVVPGPDRLPGTGLRGGGRGEGSAEPRARGRGEAGQRVLHHPLIVQPPTDTAPPPVRSPPPPADSSLTAESSLVAHSGYVAETRGAGVSAPLAVQGAAVTPADALVE